MKLIARNAPLALLATKQESMRLMIISALQATIVRKIHIRRGHVPLVLSTLIKALSTQAKSAIKKNL